MIRVHWLTVVSWIAGFILIGYCIGKGWLL